MSTPSPGEEIRPGDALSADWLNWPLELAAANVLDVDASSGLESYRTTSGTAVRAKRPLEFWAKITGAPTGTSHPFTVQISSGAGTFADGARTGTAYGTSFTTTNLTNKIVWVWWGGFNYWFESC